MNDSKRDSVRGALFLALGEILIAVLVILIYILIGKFALPVALGALLGALVSIFNFLFLTLTVNRAVDEYLRLRGEREMSEEECEAFTAEHSVRVQNAAKLSYIVRTAALLGALVIAFCLQGVFDVIATAIHLLMYRPVMYAVEAISRRKDR